MNLYLSSYKLGNEISYLKKWIQQNDSRILLIKNARDIQTQNETEKNRIKQTVEMLQAVGFEVTILDLRKYFNKKKDLTQFIQNNHYKAFFVIGGNVFVLRQAMYLSGFDEFLIENAHHNYLYAGYSAGICVLSSNLIGLDLVDEKINPYNSDKILTKGIGLIDYSIAPHYKSNHPEALAIDKLVVFFENHKINYKTIKDGDVIISQI